MNADWIPVQQAAKLSGLHQSTVHWRAAMGYLDHRKTSEGIVEISPESFRSLMKREKWARQTIKS